MSVSKRLFCLTHDLEPQAFDNFVEAGLLDCHKAKVGKVIRYQVGLCDFKKLKSGYHYVECPLCQKRMITLDVHIARMHPGETVKVPLHGKGHQERIAKTSEQKQAQSQKIRDRFQTPEGEATREQIRKSATVTANTSKVREAKSKSMRKKWADPEQRDRYLDAMRKSWENESRRQHMSLQARTNPKMVKALEDGRKTNNRTSKTHLKLKGAMVASGLKGFETEYEVGPYCVDEAHPKLRLVVEMDGRYWHGCAECGFVPYGHNARIDKAKNTYLKRRGWVVLRIPGHVVRNDLAGAVARVAQAVEHASQL